MVNKQKNKGTRFEKEAIEILERGIFNSSFNRVIGSGAFGTAMNEPLLMGDIAGRVTGFPRPLRGEAKAGYNTLKDVKSVSVRKEWIDKIRDEASKGHAFPFLVCKFDNTKKGTKYFVVLDIDDFIYLVNKVAEQVE